MFRAHGAGQLLNVINYIGTKLEHFKGAWREFEGRRVYSQQRRCSFIRRAAAVDVDGDTGDVARRVRGEEEGEVGKSVGFLSRLEQIGGTTSAAKIAAELLWTRCSATLPPT